MTRFTVQNRPRLLWAVVLGIVTVGVAILAWNAPWSQLGTALRSAHPGWLALALMANVLIYPLWIWQWKILVADHGAVTWPRMTEIVALSSLANNSLIKIAAVASSGLLLVSRGNLTSSSAASVLLLDQLLVGVVKVLLILQIVALVPLPDGALAGAAGFAGLVLILGIAVGVLLALPATFNRLSESPHKALQGVTRWLSDVSSSLQSLRHPRRVVLALLLAMAKKAGDVLAAYAVQAACGAQPSWTAALLVVGAVSLTTAVPVSPGSFGVYTATVYAVYVFIGQPPGPALAAGLLQHLVEVVPALVFGYGTLLLSRRSPAR